jgi:hypothetical protein
MMGKQFGTLPSESPKRMVTEPSGSLAEVTLFRGIGTEGVLRVVALGIVKADRPEPVHGDIL